MRGSNNSRCSRKNSKKKKLFEKKNLSSVLKKDKDMTLGMYQKNFSEKNIFQIGRHYEFRRRDNYFQKKYYDTDWGFTLSKKKNRENSKFFMFEQGFRDNKN